MPTLSEYKALLQADHVDPAVLMALEQDSRIGAGKLWRLINADRTIKQQKRLPYDIVVDMSVSYGQCIPMLLG